MRSSCIGDCPQNLGCTWKSIPNVIPLQEAVFDLSSRKSSFRNLITIYDRSLCTHHCPFSRVEAQEYLILILAKILIITVNLRRFEAQLLHLHIKNNRICPTTVTGVRITEVHGLKDINQYLNVSFNCTMMLISPTMFSNLRQELIYHCTFYNLGYIKCIQ